MTAKILNGNEAKESGLVTHVSDDPMAVAQALADEITTQSPDSVAAVKRLYNKSWIGGRGTALMRETLYQLRVILGKNSKIKTYNQTHETDKHKPFLPRKKW
jgi:enoyl-CoA hydratase/carnithine racemase